MIAENEAHSDKASSSQSAPAAGYDGAAASLYLILR